MISRTIIYVIPMEGTPGVGWDLRLTRHGGDLIIALHYGDKARPTHDVSLSVEDLRPIFEELLK